MQVHSLSAFFDLTFPPLFLKGENKGSKSHYMARNGIIASSNLHRHYYFTVSTPLPGPVLLLHSLAGCAVWPCSKFLHCASTRIITPMSQSHNQDIDRSLQYHGLWWSSLNEWIYLTASDENCNATREAGVMSESGSRVRSTATG
jgi:hypothetical protein